MHVLLVLEKNGPAFAHVAVGRADPRTAPPADPRAALIRGLRHVEKVKAPRAMHNAPGRKRQNV